MAVVTLLRPDETVTSDEEPAPPVVLLPRPDFRKRLAFLLDAANTDWPMEIEGPNGERYLAAHVVRAVTLAAQASMGWCDPGVNTALTLMGQPKVRHEDNTGIMRSFSAKLEVSDRYNNETTLSQDRIVRALNAGIRAHQRRTHSWAYELGTPREVHRKSVFIEDGVEQVISEETVRFLPIDVHGWFQASSYTGDLTDRDREVIQERVRRFVTYDITLTMRGTTVEDRIHDIVSPPVAEDKQIEIFNDNQLLQELVRVSLHGDVHEIRGHNR